MTIKCKKCSMHEQCICDASADECNIRKQSYNKAIDDIIGKCKSAMFSESDEITLSDIHQGTNSGLSMTIHFAEQLKEANRTMTNQEARQIVQNFSNWNMDDQWLSDAEMKELVKVLDNALKNIIEIKNHKITLSDLENYMKFEDECVKKNFTLKSLLEAREKQIARKPIIKSGTEVIHVNREKESHELTKSKYQDWTCPTCGYFVGQRYNSTQLTHDQRKCKFCSECGQKIDWSKKDE